MSFSPSNSHSHSEEMLSDEKLDRIFREIEEASERRALEEEADSHPSPLDPFVSSLSNAELAKKRHRQSISISRVGSYPDVPTELQHAASGAASPVPWAPPPLYRANTHTASTSSLATASSTSSHARQHEEENHTTQKETIVGRRNTLTKAMSSAFSKTLTRMRSRGRLNEVPGDDDAFVIGVSVHEATTEATAEEAGEAAVPGGDAQNGATEASEAGPSRRMSISVSAPPKAEATRSRSGSINRLRGKLPSRVQGTPADAKQYADDALAISGAGPSVDSAAKDGTKSPNANAKQGRRLSYFAKALAQRLRRRKSSEEKEKGKERGEEKTEKEEKEGEKQKQERFVPPAPIFTPARSERVDVPPLKSSSSTLAPPTMAEAAVPLPLSPHKLLSAAEIPLPPSPCAQSPAPTPTTVSSPPSPAMVPLPASPAEPMFTIPTLRVAEVDADAVSTQSGVPTESVESEPVSGHGSETSNGIATSVSEVKRDRLPQSALPDSDFGPMDAEPVIEVPPVPSPIADAAPIASILGSEGEFAAGVQRMPEELPSSAS